MNGLAAGPAVWNTFCVLTVDVGLAPLRIDVRRNGRRLIRAMTVWACDGAVRDRFLRVTEGVVAHEELEPPHHPVDAELIVRDATGWLLGLRLGDARATLRIVLRREHVTFELLSAGAPLRLGTEWDRRDGERFAGLGARHHPSVDHAGRRIQLGADRSYLGPDCPPELASGGGIPQGDYAPVPWLQSTRGYAVWCETAGNGTRFELDERVRVSVRAASGPLRLHVFGAPTPAARLRTFLRTTGMPALLPPWAYGFWKSRDVYEHQTAAEEDFHGCHWHGIPLDAIVLDSPWETQYNTWEPNPHQFPDFAGMVRRFRAAGVRTVVWVTPWVNLESLDGQIPPDPRSVRLHRAPAPNYAEGEPHFVRDAAGEPLVARWWMGTGSMVDFTSPAADDWWRAQARRVLALGVAGIKADDGEGYYVPDDALLADGSLGAASAWRLGLGYRRSMQRALDEAHGAGEGVVFGRSGWTGQQSVGVLWAGDQASDFWSLRVLVAAGISAASSGFSNWSHDIGGYLGEGGMRRCPPELLLRWVQLGCFTPLMQAHARLRQEPWTYDRRTLEIYRGYVLLHEMLVPYIRAAAAGAARHGLPVIRPLSLLAPSDEHAWAVADAFGFGPSLWVAPVMEAGAAEREVQLPPGRWIAAGSGERFDGGDEVVVPTPLWSIPVFVREGALIVTHPAESVALGLGDEPLPLVATLWGEPPGGRAVVRLADGSRVRWIRGRWSADREMTFVERL